MSGYIGDYIGSSTGIIKADTRSLDYSPYEPCFLDATPEPLLGFMVLLLSK